MLVYFDDEPYVFTPPNHHYDHRGGGGELGDMHITLSQRCKIEYNIEGMLTVANLNSRMQYAAITSSASTTTPNTSPVSISMAAEKLTSL